jgi:hypothetical protein
VRHRYAGVGQRLEHPGAVRLHICSVVGQRERPGPRVEHLDGIHARIDLHFQECGGEPGQCRHQGVPGVGRAEHHRLCALVVPAGPSLDEVGRQRERSARETDQRDVAQLTHQQPDRIGDRRNLFGLKGFDRRDVGCGADRVLDHRTDVGHDVQADARSPQRHDDVGEQDGGVDAVPAHRLQGDLGDQLGVEAGLHHRVLGAQLPVLGQRSARLPHEPHRNPARLTAADGGQVRGLRQVTTGVHRHQCCHETRTGGRLVSPRDGYGAPAHRPGQMV